MPGPRCVGLEVLHIGHQQDHFEQQIQVDLRLRGDRHHHHVAAPILGQQAAVRQLLLDPLGLGVGLVDLVNGDNDRHLGSPCMVDGFERLRHHTVVGRHHQHHNVRNFGAAGAHAGERFVTRRVDEYNLLAVLLHVVGADVLGDASRLMIRHVGLANGVQQRGFAVVHMPHDRNHGRTLLAILIHLGLLDLVGGFLFVADLVGGGSEVARQILRHLYIQGLVDGGEDLFLHQLLDQQVRFDAELFRKLLHGASFGDRDFAIDGRRFKGLLAAPHHRP